MLHTLLNKIGLAIIAFGSLFVQPTVTPQTVGSSVPLVPAVFETSLSAPISTSDTSMTLSKGTLIDGSTLSGYVSFTVDSGQPNLEYICGTASGTAVASLTRGINPLNGTSSVSALIYSHRRGANVKITDYPSLTILSRMAAGLDGHPAPIRYDSNVTNAQIIADSRNLVNYSLLAATAIAGGVPASITTLGISKLSTGAASTTNPIVVGDNDIRLTGKSGSALSSTNPPIDFNYTATTSTASRVVLASTTAKIDNSWINTGTSSNNIVQLDNSAKIPAVDGSQLTNILNTFYQSTTTDTIVSNITTKTVATTTLPANTLTTNRAIRIVVLGLLANRGVAATNSFSISLGASSLGSCGVGYAAPPSASTSTIQVTATIVANGTSSQRTELICNTVAGAGSATVSNVVQEANTSIDTSTQQNLTILANDTSSNHSEVLRSYLVELIK
jgi:hypothetical protein